MPRLVVKTLGIGNPIIELKLGANRVGRSPECDFQIEHATVSGCHCEFVLTDRAVLLRDCSSTNGTFLNGEPVKEAVLLPGQTVHLGDVELFVESTDIKVAIPKIDRPIPAPPVVRKDGSMQCSRHPEAQATYRCTHCHEVMCDACVHQIRRKGGKLLKLCPLCSHPCEAIAEAKPKKKSFFAKLTQTMRLPFVRRVRRTDL